MITGKNSVWVEKGITTIGDLVNNEGEMWSVVDIYSKWNIDCNSLLHLSLKKKIQNVCYNQRISSVNVFPQLFMEIIIPTL